MRRQFCLAIASMALATGCTMSQVQFVESPVRTEVSTQAASSAADGYLGHVYANSWGIYFLANYPYLSGGMDEEGQPEWAYFRDETRVETIVGLIRAEAERQGATHLVDLQTNWISEWSQFTLVFWIVESEGSATMLRVAGDPPPGAIPLKEIGHADG